MAIAVKKHIEKMFLTKKIILHFYTIKINFSKFDELKLLLTAVKSVCLNVYSAIWEHEKLSDCCQ